MARTLVIKDPSDGVILGRLKIPDGATQEQIIEAGTAAQAQLVAARQRAAKAAEAPAHQSAPPPGPATRRQIVCEVCREPWYEDEFPGHIEVERTRMDALERQALRR